MTSLTKDLALIARLRDAYTVAISHTMIFLLATICISIPIAFGMKWLNIKDVSAEREIAKAEERRGIIENGGETPARVGEMERGGVDRN